MKIDGYWYSTAKGKTVRWTNVNTTQKPPKSKSGYTKNLKDRGRRSTPSKQIRQRTDQPFSRYSKGTRCCSRFAWPLPHTPLALQILHPHCSFHMETTFTLRLSAHWLNRKCLHVEAEKKPSKKSKKCGAKGSVASLKESIQLGCASQDSSPRKSILREHGICGSNHAVKFSKGMWHQIKIWERKGPSRGIVQRCACAPHERSPCAPKFEERSHEETLHQERCARGVAWNVAKTFLQAQECG